MGDCKAQRGLLVHAPEESVKDAYFYRVLAENYDTANRYIEGVHTADAIVQRVRAMHHLDPGNGKRLLPLTDTLAGLANTQVEVYGVFDSDYSRWKDHAER